MKKILAIKFFALATVLLHSGCTRITRESYPIVTQDVVVSKQVPPQDCEKMGTIKANGQSLGFAYAVEILRYKVGKKGGNYVQMKKTYSSLFATAVIKADYYNCPNIAEIVKQHKPKKVETPIDNESSKVVDI